MSDDDPLPARLLAGRDRPSVLEKERVLAHVLAAPKRTAWWLGGTAGAIATTAAVVLWLGLRSPTTVPDELAARGTGAPNATMALVVRDAKLYFDLAGARGYRYFAAFAKAADGTVIWYFPATPGEASYDLEPHRLGTVLDRSIVLDRAGAYRVFAVFSTRPLHRDDITRAFDPDRSTAGPGTAVISRDLVVP